eukprot:44775-Eustigmatos_ZCMA.PRE.1
MEPADADIMLQPPRSGRAPFFDHSMQKLIMSSALSLFACVMLSAAYMTYHVKDTTQQGLQTACFAGWFVGHVLLAINCRTDTQPEM